jgi:DNA ligase (NAD+)
MIYTDTSDAPVHLQLEFSKMEREVRYIQDESIPAAAKEEAAKLRVDLMYHAWRYYWKDDPVITDAEYDRQFRRLEALEKEYPAFETPLSPTQRIGVPMPPEEGSNE